MGVHKTAIVDASAQLGDVEVGPYAVIGAGVPLADGVTMGPHAVVLQNTSLPPTKANLVREIAKVESKKKKAQEASGQQKELQRQAGQLAAFCLRQR